MSVYVHLRSTQENGRTFNANILYITYMHLAWYLVILLTFMCSNMFTQWFNEPTHSFCTIHKPAKLVFFLAGSTVLHLQVYNLSISQSTANLINRVLWIWLICALNWCYLLTYLVICYHWIHSCSVRTKRSIYVWGKICVPVPVF